MAVQDDLAGVADAAKSQAPVMARCIDHVNLSVRDLDASVEFYCRLLGVEYKEGGANDTTFQLVGSTKWSNLVLKQGFTSSSALMDWREKWIGGQGSRQGGTITQLDTAMKPSAQWEFFNAWPCKWEVSEFDASKSELAIETLELAIEGLKFKKLA